MKELIRKEFLEKRKNLLRDDINKASLDIYNNFLNSSFSNCQYIMSYISHNSEIDLKHINILSKKIYIPVIDNNDNMYPCAFGPLKKGKYGIPIPKICGKIDKNQLEIILIPGIAFDTLGNRVGYGKGYYDKFLTDYKGIKIGCCYEWQIVNKIDINFFDIKMDYLLTEKRLYNVIT